MDQKSHQKCILVAIANKVKLRFDGVMVGLSNNMRVHLVCLILGPFLAATYVEDILSGSTCFGHGVLIRLHFLYLLEQVVTEGFGIHILQSIII